MTDRATLLAMLREKMGHLPGFYAGEVPCGLVVSTEAFQDRGGDRFGAYLVLDGPLRVEGENIWFDFIDTASAEAAIAAAGAQADEDSWDLVIPVESPDAAPNALLTMMMLLSSLDRIHAAQVKEYMA